MNFPGPTIKFTLILWEEVPENLTLYLVPDEGLTPEDEELLLLTHGHLINASDVPEDVGVALDTLSDALTDRDDCLSERNPPGSRWAKRFAKYKIEGGRLPEGTLISKVIKTGYYM